MATYAIGDLQGCYEPLQRLLSKLKFDPTQDHLWFCGDLVNRGPQSLECLRFVRDLGHRGQTVLGNHDLHLLAIHFGHASPRGSDTISDILEAPDRDSLMDWLRHQPLVHYDAALNWCMSHAGVPPMWSARKARKLAQEVEAVLQNDCQSFFEHMYGNQPDVWDNTLTGPDRLRVIVNYLTRMRFIDASGRLDLVTKEGAGAAPEGFFPWFRHPSRKTRHKRLLFGHWAALKGETGTENVWALDTGCVWGAKLTALRLEDGQRFQVDASE